MSQNDEPKKSFLDWVSEFFRIPIIIFLASLLFALFTVEKLEKDLQTYAIIAVGIVYTVGSIVYAIWNEKVSARVIREKYRILKLRVKELEVLEKEVPKVMEYSLVEKHIQLKDEDGNAHFSMAYHGINISESTLHRVRHFITTEEKVEESQFSNVKFNNEDIIPQVEHTQYIKNGETSWRNDVYFETSEPVPSKGQLDTSYEVEFTKEYADAFRGGKSATLHEVSVKTDRFFVEISAPKGFYFTNPAFDVRDVFSNVEIHKEKNRISVECRPVPKPDRKKIVWNIINPRISYSYILLFNLQKKGEN